MFQKFSNQLLLYVYLADKLKVIEKNYHKDQHIFFY